MSEAGAQSPHLDDAERRQAAAGAPLGPRVIHEIVRGQGESELDRPATSLALSGLAAGLSIGFSMVVQAYLQAGLPEAPWRDMVAGFGYSVGFLIVILGRQQLFTETTLTALIPALTHPTPARVAATLRVWAVVLAANLAGTWIFATIAAQPGIFAPEATARMAALAQQAIGEPFWRTMVLGGSAGWLIGLMVWLLPSAGGARPLIIVLLTYVVAVCHFPHVVAGSVEAAFGVASGHATVRDYALGFLLPTLIGNSLGGSVLAALLNHAPLANELHPETR